MPEYDTGDEEKSRWKRLMEKTREKVRDLGINEGSL